MLSSTVSIFKRAEHLDKMQVTYVVGHIVHTLRAVLRHYSNVIIFTTDELRFETGGGFDLNEIIPWTDSGLETAIYR
jgi:hypothetical protein